MSGTTKRSNGEYVQNRANVRGTDFPLGYQQITATGSSVGLVVPTGARLARVNCEAQAARWRDDGVAPTATVGILQAVGETLEYSGDLSAIRFIAATAGTILNVSYYG